VRERQGDHRLGLVMKSVLLLFATVTSLSEDVLQKAFAEWKSANPTTILEVKEGAVCTPKGECK